MNRKESRSSRENILDAAEELMSRYGYHAVSMRQIAREADANLGSVTYFFGTKEGLLEAIYARHTQPMNERRIELLNEARRISSVSDRLPAIVRAYVLPAFSSSKDSAGGGARFTRLRAVLSMEGNAIASGIIARSFDDTTREFIRAIMECLPHLTEHQVVWRCHFLLGSLYYTLVNADRIGRITEGRCDGSDQAMAIDELVNSTVAALQNHQESLAEAVAVNQ